jgi:hypothetical protein
MALRLIVIGRKKDDNDAQGDADSEDDNEVVGTFIIEREEEIRSEEKDMCQSLKCGRRTDVPQTKAERIGTPLTATNKGHMMLQKMGYSIRRCHSIPLHDNATCC